MSQFRFLCEVEDKVVVFVVVYMARNSTNSTFPRTDAQVYLCCSMAWGSLDHDIKDTTWCVLCEIKCHRPQDKDNFYLAYKWATPPYMGTK